MKKILIILLLALMITGSMASAEETAFEDFDLDFIPHVARKHKFNYGLCNSFGFGGTNGSLLFKKG